MGGWWWKALSTLRILAAATFLTVLAIVWVHDLLYDVDYHWPVSTYPMFSSGRTPEKDLTVVRLHGVTDAGTEIEIRDSPPIDNIRLQVALANMSKERLPQALTHLARKHRYPVIRLYRERWQAGGTQIVSRELVLEGTDH